MEHRAKIAVKCGILRVVMILPPEKHLRRPITGPPDDLPLPVTRWPKRTVKGENKNLGKFGVHLCQGL